MASRVPSGNPMQPHHMQALPTMPLAMYSTPAATQADRSVGTIADYSIRYNPECGN